MRSASAVDAQSTTTWSHSPGCRQLADLVQAEHLLNAGQRRKFFWGNVSQIGLGKPAGEQAGDLAPPRLQQRQRVQRQRVEEPAARRPASVGEHPGGLTHARSA